MKFIKQHNERGMVSIFIVIFTALLVAVISVSFIRLMIQTQQQATTADLSQSAYDSAQAGQEDAKRLLVVFEKECVKAAVPAPRCAAYEQLLRVTMPCDTIQQSGIIPSATGAKEVLIKQTEGDEILQQAYTCVKISIDTNDYIGSVNSNSSRIVPLRAMGDFNQVVLEWFSQTDLQDASNTPGEKTVQLGSDLLLPKPVDWPKNRPALMRAQLMQFGPGFKLSDFDKKADGSSNAHTLFLNPNTIGLNDFEFSEDRRMSNLSDVLKRVKCDPAFSTSTVDKSYACRVVLTLPTPVTATDTAYLRLDPIYNSLTHFSVMLQQAGSPVKFKDVQPIIDSTGRANDLFRRIQARVELENDIFPYPESAVDITGSLCKSFLVTDKLDDYNDGGLCDPNA